MGYNIKYTRGWCDVCGENVKLEKQVKDTNHILHLLLSVFTGGLWVPIWILAVFNFDTDPINGATCSQCGSSRVTRTKHLCKDGRMRLDPMPWWQRTLWMVFLFFIYYFLAVALVASFLDRSKPVAVVTLIVLLIAPFAAWWYWKRHRKPRVPSKPKGIYSPVTKSKANKIIEIDIVGESFKNKDGTSRQYIIENHAKVGAPAYLHFYTFKGSPACAVSIDGGQIGHLPKEKVTPIKELVKVASATGAIITHFGKSPGGLYGVKIEIRFKY